jgi:uncharacterized membrane protein
LGPIIYKQGTKTISLRINYLQTRNNNNITWDQLFTNKEQQQYHSGSIIYRQGTILISLGSIIYKQGTITISLGINYLQTRNNNNITQDQLFTNKEQQQYHSGSIIYKQGTITISLRTNYLQTRNKNNITQDQLFTNKEQKQYQSGSIIYKQGTITISLGSIIYKQGTITISLGINYLQTRNNNNITQDQLFTNKEQ